MRRLIRLPTIRFVSRSTGKPKEYEPAALAV
jgi:hypothetical protein